MGWLKPPTRIVSHESFGQIVVFEEVIAIPVDGGFGWICRSVEGKRRQNEPISARINGFGSLGSLGLGRLTKTPPQKTLALSTEFGTQKKMELQKDSYSYIQRDDVVGLFPKPFVFLLRFFGVW